MGDIAATFTDQCPLCRQPMSNHTPMVEPTGQWGTNFDGSKSALVRPVGWRCPEPDPEMFRLYAGKTVTIPGGTVVVTEP